MIKNMFITGSVGIGKTTLIKEVTFPCRSDCGGFYTEEIREDGHRQGFSLHTFDGNAGILAWKGKKSPHRLGKYGVDLSVLESIGVGAINDALEHKKIIVIDEIGSMEMMSKVFHESFLKCLVSDKPVLATIRLRAQPFSKDIQRLESKEVIVLTKENFIRTKMRIKEWIEKCLIP